MTFHKIQQYLRWQGTSKLKGLRHIFHLPSSISHPPSFISPHLLEPRNAFYFYLYFTSTSTSDLKTVIVPAAASSVTDKSNYKYNPTLSSTKSWVPQPSSNTPSANSSPTAKATKPKSSPKAPPSKTSPTQPSTSPARNAALLAPP